MICGCTTTTSVSTPATGSTAPVNHDRYVKRGSHVARTGRIVDSERAEIRSGCTGIDADECGHSDGAAEIDRDGDIGNLAADVAGDIGTDTGRGGDGDGGAIDAHECSFVARRGTSQASSDDNQAHPDQVRNHDECHDECHDEPPR
jgi:hypothetical protein